MCGTDSVSRPSIFIGLVMNLRAGRKKKKQQSALGAENLAPRDCTGDETGTQAAGVSEGEKDQTADTLGQWWEVCSGDKRDFENRRAESYSIGSSAELNLLSSCEKSQAHHEMVGMVGKQ